MQISFINDEISSNIDEALAFARKNKLRYIELRRIDGKDITELTPAEACALAEKITSAGILVSALSSPFLKWKENTRKFTFSGRKFDKETDYFTALMDLADIFGAPNIRIYIHISKMTAYLLKKSEKNSIFTVRWLWNAA